MPARFNTTLTLSSQNEYLVAENRILRSHLPPRLRLSDPERSTLAEIGKRLGRKDLQLIASVALPDTTMAWYRRLIAQCNEPLCLPSTFSRYSPADFSDSLPCHSVPA